MAACGVHAVEIFESKLGKILENPESFFKPHSENTSIIKELSQKSYVTAANDKLFKGKSLSQLYIDGFDEEQIWQQSDLLNKSTSENLSELIHSFNATDILPIISKNLQIESSVENKCNKQSPRSNKKLKENEESISSQESEVEEYAFDDDSDSPTELTRDRQEKLLIQKSSAKTSRRSSVVDDQFFKLSKLDEFLTIEDIKEERRDDNASDDDIDLFQDIPSDSADASDEGSDHETRKAKKSSRDLMYADFFDDPESEIGDENDSAMDDDDDDDKSFSGKNSDYSFDGSDSDVELKNNISEENAHNKISENISDSKSNQKTAFELEQEKIKRKIQEYEKSMLQPLPWHLTGEVAAGSRPIDSLIHQDADFDSNTKQDLLVDIALTQKIEEITIMAIKNKAFFDVERKVKPTEDVINYKKEVALEQTKNKKSLAEVYEEDYLKKQNKQEENEKEDPKHKEIKKLMDSVLPQLHALFSHIPKPAIPEIKIVSNLPAVTVEEVAPTSVSDAALLAPEEVKKKSGLIKGKTERTDTDRKRERRKKKIHQKLKEKKTLEKLESQKGNPSAKVSKLQKLQTLKKIKQHKNTKIANIDEGGKIKSSKDFFSRLQDTVNAKTNTEIPHKKKKFK